MPSKFYDIASRVDHILSALLPQTVDKLNISQNFDLTVKFPTEPKGESNFTINGHSFSVPLTYEVNYGNIDQIYVDYGVTSICSLYKNNLNTFAQKAMQLEEKIVKENSFNNEVLLAGECSDAPRIAIFVAFENGTNNFSHVKIYTAGNFITITADGEPTIVFNGTSHTISHNAPFEYPFVGGHSSDFK